MKTLILLRHAKSSWKYPELPDVERPLNKRGRNDAPEIGKWLKKNAPIPDHILTSHSVRTLATISKVGKGFGLKGEAYRTDTRLYHASPSTLFEIVHSIPDHIHTALLVGHNPGLTDFANQLCPFHAIENIPTCGVYGVKLHGKSWKEAGNGKAEFLFFQFPRNL